MKVTMVRIITGICGVIVILMGKWVSFFEKSYTILGFFEAIRKSGGLLQLLERTTGSPAELIQADVLYTNWALAKGLLYIPLVIIICVLIRILVGVAGRRTIILSVVIYGGLLVHIFAIGSFGLFQLQPAMLICAGIFTFEALLCIFLEQRREINEKAEELKQRERREREERKRRLEFPGSYSCEFYRIIWKNFKFNWKNYAVFSICGGILVTFLFVIIGMYLVLKSYGQTGDIFSETGLVSVLKEVFPVIIVIGIFLMILVISYYIRMRIKSYGMFINLGIRRHTFKRMITIEVLGSIGASVISGAALGSGLLLILQAVIKDRKEESVITIGTFAIALLFTMLLLSFILLLAGLVNYHMLECFSIAQAERKEAESEKLPSRIACILLCLLGADLARSAYFGFANPKMAEGFANQISVILGMMLLFYYGFGLRVRQYHKNKQKKEHNLIKKITWHFRFKTNARQWVLMFGVQMLAFSIFIPRLAGLAVAEKQAGQQEEQFPYEYVSMAYEEENLFFEELKQTYHVEIQTFPMVRVTTVQGKPFGIIDILDSSFSKVIWPQGQHVGISESTYKEWKKQLGQSPKNLQLKGEEIYIVYQQDGSVNRHPLEYYMGSDTPHMREGQPLRYYDVANRTALYPPYKVAGEETEVLSGIFQQGYQENIVVYADEYFETVRDEIQQKNRQGEEVLEGPTTLQLLRVPKQSQEKVKKEMEEFKERNKRDSSWDESILPVYGKQESIENLEADRKLMQLAYSFIVFMLFTCNLIIFYLKFSAEQRERNKQKYFYRCMGMSDKEIDRQSKQEFRRLAFGPMIAAICSSLFFIGMRVVLRMYEPGEAVTYFFCAAIIIGGYVLLQELVFGLFQRQLNCEGDQEI